MTRAARVQGVLAIAVLVLATAITVVLVAPPVSSRPTPGLRSARPTLPSGLRVEVRGGDPFLAHRLADRLAVAGATLGAVAPGDDGDVREDATMIVYYDRGQMSSAERIRAMLGRGTLRRQQVFEPGIDVTIVPGRDLSRL